MKRMLRTRGPLTSTVGTLSQAALAPSAYRNCSSRWYYERPTGASTWREIEGSHVPGADYGCSDESLDVQSLQPNASKAARAEASRVCRVCAAGAAALCEDHGPRCAGFVLDSARSVATLKGAACAKPTPFGNVVFLKASWKAPAGADATDCSPPRAGPAARPPPHSRRTPVAR